MVEPVRLDYLAVGHATVDVEASGARRPGGSVLYAAAVAADLGLRVGVATRCGPDMAPERHVPWARWSVARDESSTVFDNRYDASGARRQRVLSVAGRLLPEDVPRNWRSVGVLHVAPVLDEVDAAAVGSVTAEFVGLTAQGWLRDVGADGAVRPGPWRVPDALLGRSNAVVLSEEDIGGDPDRVRWLAERVPVAVLTMGGAGAVAWSADGTWRQPAAPSRPRDWSGAGDAFAAALFVRLWEGAPVPEAMAFAAAAAALAIETVGPAAGLSRPRVARRQASAATSRKR